MNIFVSAFISNINIRNDRNVEKYIDYGNKLLYNINCYKVIFIEKDIFKKYFNLGRGANEIGANEIGANEICTRKFNYEDKVFFYLIENKHIFVFFEKTDIYLYNYNNVITKFNVSTDNPAKDTIEYMFVQCHKTEWVKIAINLITHITSTTLLLGLNNDKQHFIWIDFGIYHMFNDNNELFKNCLEHLSVIRNNNNEIRIASCINPMNINPMNINPMNINPMNINPMNINPMNTYPMNTYHIDIYKHVAWYFAGSIFGGSRDTLLKFAELMKTECINIIQERHHLMWEVNIWYLIYLKHPELFEPYLCNHNPSIIQNY